MYMILLLLHFDISKEVVAAVFALMVEVVAEEEVVEVIVIGMVVAAE